MPVDFSPPILWPIFAAGFGWSTYSILKQYCPTAKWYEWGILLAILGAGIYFAGRYWLSL